MLNILRYCGLIFRNNWSKFSIKRSFLGYNAYRELCGMPKALNFEDLLKTMDEDAVKAFKNIYSSVDDIDLFSGMMSEKPLQGLFNLYLFLNKEFNLFQEL